MAMGGSGVASATKFNAAFHNPALIAFNRGRKPDKLYASGSMGLRETYGHDFEDKINTYQATDLKQELLDSLGSPEQAAASLKYRQQLEDMNLISYRSDELSAFSALVDTLPFTVGFYTRKDVREMSVIRNRDEALIERIYQNGLNPDNGDGFAGVANGLISSVDDTTFEISEFGVTVATTNVIDYNIPISWGFTPKLMEIRGSHRSTFLSEYDLSDRPQKRVSTGLLEWNLDIGFAALLTDDFMQEQLGLDGAWLEGEWVFGFVGMNLFPSDFTPARAGDSFSYPAIKRSIQALYQIGIAHYREKYMLTLDIDLVENEIYDFEGLTRFVTFGSEYYWRDDFHLRAGIRLNTAQSTGGAKDKAILTGGFLYQPHGFTVEAAAMINDIEMGGSVGFGVAF